MSESANPETLLDPIALAIAAMGRGEAVLVVDDEDRENEGDIIFAAQHSTPALMGWTIRHSSGVICIPMEDSHADRLALPPMVEHNQDAKGTAYTVSCDAAVGVVDDSGEMLRLQGLREFANDHGLVLVSIADLVAHVAQLDSAASLLGPRGQLA